MISRFALTALALSVVAGAAHAAEAPVQVFVHPGPLSLGPVKVLTSPSGHGRGLVRVLVQVTDARGDGRGWILGGRRVGAGSRVLGMSIRCAPKSTCTPPTLPSALPVALMADRTTPVVAAASGTGMGRIDVTLTLSGGAARFSLRSA